jgi:Histone methylation protein DOT1
LLALLWEFAIESLPSRKRLRFGDTDYDWEYRVNTTSGAVKWKERLLGKFHSEYQPTEPGVFHEMMALLREQGNFDFADYTFVDLGSGKGRTLLMASDYPFRTIIGVELLSALNQIAEENISKYKSDSRQCFDLQTFCADAGEFELPMAPYVLFLFNPFPESVLFRVRERIEASMAVVPKSIYILYHNPLLEHVLLNSSQLEKITGGHQYSLFKSRR